MRHILLAALLAAAFLAGAPSPDDLDGCTTDTECEQLMNLPDDE
jgi:hypothetical protein